MKINNNVRYVYVKQNNAVRELQRVSINPEKLTEGGPDAYVAHFMRLTQGCPVLLLSTHFLPTDRDEVFLDGNVTAKSYYWYSRLLKPFGMIATKPIGTFFPRLVKSIKIFIDITNFKPTHILCWAASFPLWTTYLASKFTNAKFVYSRHNRIYSDKEVWYQNITGYIDQWIMRHASAVICNGPYLRDQLLAIGVEPEKIFEFNWNFKHLLTKQEDESNVFNLNNIRAPKIILFVGRIQESKGVFDLLEASAGYLRDEKEVMLAYAGDGSDLENLKKQVQLMKLENKVIFLGMIPHNKLAAVIRPCMCVVTPTRSWFPEGRCMATMEGLVMGKPVIAPDYGPFPYLVKHRVNGLLFKADSVRDLGEKINMMLTDKCLYQHLCEGAEKSSIRLSSEPANFTHAVKDAFLYRF